MTPDQTALQVPAQLIPVPKLISSQAQAFLTAAHQRINASLQAGPQALNPVTNQDDNAAAALAFLGPLAQRFRGSVETIELPQGAKCYRTTPDGRSGRRVNVAYYDIHGGGFTSGGGELCKALAKLRAMDYGVEIFSVDYRLAPNHPFPAALDDCMAAYDEVLKRYAASDVVLAGASAGGNLAAAVILRARDEGRPLPVALILQTPATDLTNSGDSRHTNRFLDSSLYGDDGDGPNAYVGDADPKLPYLSPLFGEFKAGWPPTILTSGTRDLLLSDTVCMHRALRRAGIKAELHISEAAPHGGFMGSAPEDAEVTNECRRFANAAWMILE
jgi:epsilon-lactone hydrolase